MERTREEKMAIANEILRQLGGHKFVVMTGAKDILALDSGLRFKLPGKRGYARQGIDLISVILEPSDTYTMKFEKTCGHLRAMISEHAGIYDDQLQGIFTAETGLDTHL